MSKLDVVQEILRFNRDLDPRRVKLKYERMRSNTFAFFRATCHLFYKDIPREPVFDQAPKAWISGDLHVENFGSYKGDNRLAYFDMNDFDEACLAPASWELLRFLTSVLLASADSGIGKEDQMVLCHAFLNRYRAEIKTEKPRWIERSLSKGLIGELLKSLGREKRELFLDTRSKVKGKERRLRIDGKKAIPTKILEREQVLYQMDQFAREQEHPGFFRVLDMADRISGLGSLGVSRYVLLVSGSGGTEGNFLLDLKEARPSSAALELAGGQPKWTNHAVRVVSTQKRSQAISPALLTTIGINGRSFILKELQPSEHRVNLDSWDGKIKRKEEVIASMGALAAWGQLRCASFQGSAPSNELGNYGKDPRWVSPLIDLAIMRKDLVLRSFREYCVAFDAGEFAGKGAQD